ncbi:histone deacetylase 7-like isoform X2 [Centrocercus urophasianus]|uniref:histone deacetylase 7-like isoform X2 n=1 Tax=Centrocercus urophasianus TaxID=9002 RepID=UPI001C64FE44|nr:histone deacetylase 7-like isoform X2 [Centrocercus urophasianus]
MFAFPSARAAPGQRVLLQCCASLRSLLGGQTAVTPCTSPRVPQAVPMDLRIGQRVVKPGSDTALLALKHTQQLQHQLFLASLHQQQVEQLAHQHVRVTMETSHREAEPGQQEQELRQILNKDKSKRSAVASTVVKQKLAEVILKKQQAAALERTSNPNPPAMPYRSLEPLDPEGPSPPVLSTFLSPVPSTSLDPPEHFPLRKTASEPNLKVRCKPRKCLDRRKNPLTRKESAPPSLKRRPPETIDSSPSSSSTPVSGCSSPNDSLPAEHGALPTASSMAHEAPLAQRLMMQESSLAQFALQSAVSLPAITLGLPATTSARGDADRRPLSGLAHRVPVLNGPVLTGTHSPMFIPAGLEQHEAGSPLSPRLQPVIILEPSVTHAPLVAVPGLGTVPFSFAPSLISAERLSLPGHHKPLGRTRSEPLPQNPKAIQQQLVYQQHHAQFLERLKQQTHLGKRMVKTSEKPRLRQIPSSEDMEAEGMEAGAESSEQARACVEPARPGSSGKEPERPQKMLQPQEELILQQAYLWDPYQRVQHQLLKRQPLADSPMVPTILAGHRPLSRAQSSPATATVSLPAQDTTSKALSLPVQEQTSKPHFTTGLVYDSVMLKHQCSCGDNSNHPEHAGRIQSIWSRLQERGLRSQCECLRGRKATLEELQCVHTERHVFLYGTNPLNRLKLDNGKLAGILSQRMFVMLPCGGVGVSAPSLLRVFLDGVVHFWGPSRGPEWRGNSQSHRAALSPQPCVSVACPDGAQSLEVSGVEAGLWPLCRENGLSPSNNSLHVDTGKCPSLPQMGAGYRCSTASHYPWEHLESGPLQTLPPGNPATTNPLQPHLRAKGFRREQICGMDGTPAACRVSHVPVGWPRCSVGFHQGYGQWHGDISFPLLSGHFCGLSSQSLLPWFSLHSLHSPLFLSPRLCPFFSPSLSGRVSPHAFLLPLLVLLLSLPPLLGTSSSQPRLHPLSLLCLPPCPPLAAPSRGRGENLSCTHGVDQKRLEFSGSGSALDVILIKPRCLVKQ